MVYPWDQSLTQGFFCTRTMVSDFISICSHADPSLCSFSVLPAISLNEGILHCEIVEGSFCTATFQHFIKGLLGHMEPFPSQNSVIVMDNCHIHKHPDILEMIESRCVMKLRLGTSISNIGKGACDASFYLCTHQI